MSSLLRFLSRIWIRLLAFNVLLVFLPAFGILFFRAAENKLLEQQERSMVQQGRILAAALGEQGPLTEEEAQRILINMSQRFDARLRVIDGARQVLADSSHLGPRRADDEAPPLPRPESQPRESPVYRLGLVLYRLYGRVFLPPEPPREEAEPEVAAEAIRAQVIEKALAGAYGRDTRVSPETGALTLYSGIPIRSGGEVVGVALVSKSTFQILRALYDLRLSTFKIVLASIAAAVVLSLLVSTTIVHPIRRLRREAHAILDRRGRLRGTFTGFDRRDEIGDLSRALAELTRRLEAHIRFIESFASDVSHEFKNPLAAIRNATEILADVEDPAERRRFITMVLKDVARLEHLLSGVREVTRIDAEVDAAPAAPVRLEPILAALVERYEMSPATASYRLTVADPEVAVPADPERLTQVFENLLDNAASFSPPGGEVEISLAARDKSAVVAIRDHGPGVPAEHLERIFDRFFSYRQNGAGGAGRHTGLGLSIVKAIVEGYGGAVEVRNHEGGGAVFEVRLPLRL